MSWLCLPVHVPPHFSLSSILIVSPELKIVCFNNVCDWKSKIEEQTNNTGGAINTLAVVVMVKWFVLAKPNITLFFGNDTGFSYDNDDEDIWGWLWWWWWQWQEMKEDDKQIDSAPPAICPTLGLGTPTKIIIISITTKIIIICITTTIIHHHQHHNGINDCMALLMRIILNSLLVTKN